MWRYGKYNGILFDEGDGSCEEGILGIGSLGYFFQNNFDGFNRSLEVGRDDELFIPIVAQSCFEFVLPVVENDSNTMGPVIQGIGDGGVASCFSIAVATKADGRDPRLDEQSFQFLRSRECDENEL